jgi:hypothetical protein
MADQRIEFGKRRPVRLSERPPDREPAPKRSRHVALLMFGAIAVGGTAYAVMERRNCQPAPPAAPGVAAPAPPQGSCTSRGSFYGGGTRYSYFSGGSSGAASTGGSDFASGSVSRGGFGGFARAFGFGSS